MRGKSTIKEEYRKARERYRERIRYYKKQGYVFDEQKLLKLKLSPRKKDIEALEKQRGETLLKKAVEFVTDEGEVIKPKEAIYYKRKKTHKKRRNTTKYRPKKPKKYKPEEGEIIDITWNEGGEDNVYESGEEYYYRLYAIIEEYSWTDSNFAEEAKRTFESLYFYEHNVAVIGYYFSQQSDDAINEIQLTWIYEMRRQYEKARTCLNAFKNLCLDVGRFLGNDYEDFANSEEIYFDEEEE